MRCAIYCRVSTDEQNPENQRLELERFAKAMGWDFQVFEEKESTRNTRPVKNQIYQESLQKKWDLILVWKLDRWGRSLAELVTELDILKKHNVQFRTLRDNIILDDNPTNQLMINILSSFAQFERDVGRDRTRAGQARARVQGKRIGRHPKNCKYGNYRDWETDRKSTRLNSSHRL